MADSDVSLKPKVDLAEEADWSTAVSKVLANQSAYNNVISEVLKGITRIVGWLLLTLVRSNYLFKQHLIIHYLGSLWKCLHRYKEKEEGSSR